MKTTISETKPIHYIKLYYIILKEISYYAKDITWPRLGVNSEPVGEGRMISTTETLVRLYGMNTQHFKY